MDEITPRSPGVSRAPSDPDTAESMAFGASHPGRLREENEDAFVVAPDLGLAAVADGVAGSKGGKLASHAVISAIHGFFARATTRRILSAARPDVLAEMPAVLEAAMAEAHAELRHEAQDSGFDRMATTLAMVLLTAGHAFVMHAGDSRVYRLRDGTLERLTEDHTALTRWTKQYGGLTISWATQLEHVLLRAVSARGDTALPELRVEPILHGDVFLLATDGLTRAVSDEEIRRIILDTSDLKCAVHALLDAALAGGGQDNVTAALLRHREGPS